MIIKLVSITAFLFFIFQGPSSKAFPEMIRHHYVNCGACHVNTSGGGVLNAYGRTISYEVLSTWGGPKEAQAFYSIDPEKVGTWLNMGGDLRGLQVHQENDKLKRGRYFWMQGNFDVSVAHEKTTVYMSVGQVQTTDQSFRWISPKYWLAYQFNDEISLRAGRSIPVYGLNIPQHQDLIKQNLGLGPGTDRDVIDFQYNGEIWNWMLGFSRSLANSAVREDEKAIHLQMQTTIKDSHKLGISIWNGDAESYKKTMAGVHGVFGFSERAYALAEIDHLSWTLKSTSVETKSIYQLLKLGYEFYKGIHLQGVQEWGKPNTDDSRVEIQNFGLGLVWYPRPHFEIESLWSKRRTLGTSDRFEDYAYVLTHFYF